jgi:bacterioferritin-associated ferredoxin
MPGNAIAPVFVNKGPGAAAMIICSCNVFSDDDVRSVIEARPSTTGTAQVYRGLGHEPQCGRCAHTIRKIMDETASAGGDQY